MRVLACLGLAALLLSGCSKPADGPAGPRVAADAAAASETGGTEAKPHARASVAIANAMLAYKYAYGLQAPAAQIQSLVAKHERACEAAGVALCQVTGGATEVKGPHNIYATLTLQGDPAWLNRFRDTIAGDAKAVHGRVVKSATTTEDLSRQIVDGEAALKAKTALRDRIQQILETRLGKMSELMDVENTLAQVQSDLDTMQSELAAMRERVASSVMTIDYTSTAVMAPEANWTPVVSAVNAPASTMIAVIALMVRLASVLLPWAVVVGAAAWFVRRLVPALHPRARPVAAGQNQPAA